MHGIPPPTVSVTSRPVGTGLVYGSNYRFGADSFLVSYLSVSDYRLVGL